ILRTIHMKRLNLKILSRKFALTIIFGSLIGFILVSSIKSQPQKSILKAQAATPTPIAVTQKTATPVQIGDYLSNPGIGWQEAHTLSNPLLPETVSYRRSTYGWAAQNPGDGNFDWSAVDNDLGAAVASGKQFSFRIYTMKGPGFGGAQIPQWVFDKGATLKDSSPDYSNCVYQEEWGKFVNAMKAKYDGNTNISFIDISGYGNFNEWSWTDGQTVFDGDFSNPGSLDGQARKRLADMFIGGSGSIQCRDKNGQIQTVSYSYPGFSRTQLVMPYAGVRQSNEYVNARRADVGLRNDCLGRAGNYEDVTSKVGNVIQRVWPVAPVVFEYCGSASTNPELLSQADLLLRWAHGSLTHDNFSANRDLGGLTNILRNAGYRYYVKNASFPSGVVQGGNFTVDTTWTNSGYAPNYPRMGQTFSVHYYLVDANGNAAVDQVAQTNTASWIPGDHVVNPTLNIPGDLATGTYTLKVAVIEARTGRAINLALAGRDAPGRYPLDTIDVFEASQIASPTPTGTGTATPTPTSSPTPTPVVQATPTPTPVVQATPTPTGSESPTATFILASASTQTSGCTGLTATPNKGVVPLNVNFTGQGFDQGRSISMYEFDFGDSSGGQLKLIRQASAAASHRYYNPGTYTATLKVLTSSGQWVGGAGCSVTIATTGATGVVEGVSTATTLPQTGPAENIAAISVIVGAAGFYINKHFKRLV
ncbi:MAG TPA: DUF4832 domain-containing protein, partial [Patescibacteria group bacterium]